METYYAKYFGIPGWTENPEILPDKKDMILAAHDMIRLANSIARPAYDLLQEVREKNYEIAILKQKLKSSNNPSTTQNIPDREQKV